MTDRIKLAEAMGWRRVDEGTDAWWPAPYVVERLKKLFPNAIGINYVGLDLLPDPENDANDDYAVLDHMKAKCGIGSDCPDWQMWDSFVEEVPVAVENREIGDYYRAALMVLE